MEEEKEVAKPAMGRQEIFEKSLKMAQEEKENSGSFSHREYEEIPYIDLEANVPKVVRVVGEPMNVRTLPTSPKKVLSSKILTDKQKNLTFRWSEDRNWILWRIYNTVMHYVWDPDAINPSNGKKGLKIFSNIETYPNLFNRVRWNNKVDNDMERGWNPAVSVMMNVIDREEYDWHVANKSYKLISKKGTQDKKKPEMIWHEPGIPITCYDSILASVVEEHGDWEDFDIAIMKLQEDPWYKVYSTMDERKIESKIKVKMSSVPLTAEEKSWRMYDLDHYYNVTSYTKILNHLGSFIAEVDACFNKTFIEELKAFSKKEKETWAAEKKNDVNDEDDDDDAEKKEEPKKEPEAEKKEPPKAQQRVRTSLAVSDKFSEARKASWKGIDKLTEAEKASVKSIKLGDTPENDSVVFVDDAGIVIPEEDDSLLPCFECGLIAPDSIKTCMKCGVEFQ